MSLIQDQLTLNKGPQTPCTGGWTRTMGLPCRHSIQSMLELRACPQLSDVHAHWHFERGLTGTEARAPPRAPETLPHLEPEVHFPVRHTHIISGRRALAGTGVSGTRRDPSDFELAVSGSQIPALDPWITIVPATQLIAEQSTTVQTSEQASEPVFRQPPVYRPQRLTAKEEQALKKAQEKEDAARTKADDKERNRLEKAAIEDQVDRVKAMGASKHQQERVRQSRFAANAKLRVIEIAAEIRTRYWEEDEEIAAPIREAAIVKRLQDSDGHDQGWDLYPESFFYHKPSAQRDRDRWLTEQAQRRQATRVEADDSQRAEENPRRKLRSHRDEPLNELELASSTHGPLPSVRLQLRGPRPPPVLRSSARQRAEAAIETVLGPVTE